MRTCEQLCRAVQQAWTAPLLSATGHHCGSHCPGVGGVCGPRTLRAALFSVVAASLRCLYRPWSFPGQNTGVGSLSLLQGIFPTQRSPALQVDSLPAESQEKPKNTGVGSLSLPQRIFLSQESNQGLLHCRCILYQLSYQESPSQLKCHLLWGVSPDPLA